jgi:O-antigen/teichoic acid export membrane protein
MVKKIDTFGKNIILVFMTTSLANVFNLLYQLLIAHRLSPIDFAAFNSLLAMFVMVASPLGTLQMAVAKYTAEYDAHHQPAKIKALVSGLLRKVSLPALISLPAFYFLSLSFVPKSSAGLNYSATVLSILVSLSWIAPILSGGIQGLELFKWLATASVISGALKLILAFAFILIGFKISGALGALLVANLVAFVFYLFPLRKFISFSIMEEERINFKEIMLYLWPVAISAFCFIALVNYDMLLVKYFFSPAEAGIYSLAQMVGKIFLFLPVAISVVLFPRVSGLHAKNEDTHSALKRSLFYASGLCVLALIIYNTFPSFILKLLTGKAFSESILLGRLFSISMSFFALFYVLITYFLSKGDLRFIKYLVISTALEFLAIIFLHNSLAQVQIIICLNAFFVFLIGLKLLNKR